MTRQHRNITNKAIRGALYGIVVVPTLLGLIINFSSNQLPFIKFVYWLIALVSTSFLVELLIAYKKSSSKYIFSSSQIRLTTELDSLIPLIKKSNDIAILCDTLKSFTDDESRIKSLLKRIDEGCTLRVLVLNPKCEIINQVCEARKINGRPVESQKLSDEIRHSLSRIISIFGEIRTAKIVRLYSHYPTYSLYKFDSNHMICTYAFGRGGSSPAFIIDENEKTNDFCIGIQNGFNELWDAKTTVKFTMDLINP